MDQIRIGFRTLRPRILEELLQRSVLAACVLRRRLLTAAPIGPREQILDVAANVGASDVRRRGWQLALLKVVGEVPDPGEVAVDGLLAPVLATRFRREVLRELSDAVQVPAPSPNSIGKSIAAGALF